MRRFAAALAAALLLGLAMPAQAASGSHPKLDAALNKRASAGKGTRSRVIVTFHPGWDASEDSRKLGAKLGRRLGLINARALEIQDNVLQRLADHPGVAAVHLDRPVRGAMDRTAVTTGARTIHQSLGFTGAGVGVAVIDSGITSWHNDLTSLTTSSSVMTTNGQRIAAFVDYVNGQTSAYDDNGHGTHVSGIIAGNGVSSLGYRAGVAPMSHIVSLKVLDVDGQGVISNVIAALDFVVQNRSLYNIRVVNVSVGADVAESFTTDPLTLAAKRATDAGVVVVAAAGNAGSNSAGEPQYGGITAPGNAPWVLTVGASSHQGTHLRYDDSIASFSSRGPTRFNYLAKPDLVAPGVGIVSLSDPASQYYTTQSAYLIGSASSSYKPYLSLSGTSMSAPVVAGTAALMIQANPALTPNLVKAILQYTAQAYDNYDPLTQGAGFLNAKGAVELARFFGSAQPGDKYPSNVHWSRRIHWGNHRISGGVISPSANAWLLSTVWGASRETDGDNIVWGTDCEDDSCDNIVWGTFDTDGDNIVWGTSDSDGTDGDGDNIVWGTFCEDDSCDNIVWGTLETDGDNIVWGTDCDGEDCGDNIVWGTFCEGAECGDNIVWGTLDSDGDNIVWGTYCEGAECGDNIVWGTECEGADCDNIVWGTATADGAVYDETTASWGTVWTESAFDWLFIAPQPVPAATDPTAVSTIPTTSDSSAATESTTVDATTVVTEPIETIPVEQTTTPTTVTLPGGGGL